MKKLKRIPFKYMVAFEGLNYSFKETNSKKLVEYIQDELGYECKLFSFHNCKNSYSHLLKNCLKNARMVKELDAYNLSLLYSFDLYITWYNEIKKYYNDGYIIVMDRWIYSNIYYQGVTYLQDDLKSIGVDDFEYYDDVSNRLNLFARDYCQTIYHKFGLPDSNLILKMVHDRLPIKYLPIFRNPENNVNESVFEYLESVKYLFDKYSLGCKDIVSVQKISLDKDEKEFKSRDDIFDDVRKRFLLNFNTYLKQSKNVKCN